MSDERPRYVAPPGKRYIDLMREAAAAQFGLELVRVDDRALVSAQVIVDRRQFAAWWLEVAQRCREHGWHGDPHELLGLLYRSDLPRLYLPD